MSLGISKEITFFGFNFVSLRLFHLFVIFTSFRHPVSHLLSLKKDTSTIGVVVDSDHQMFIGSSTLVQKKLINQSDKFD
jgi:hypothetical protein